MFLNLSRVLNVPSAFFLRPPTQIDTDSPFYRSMSAVTKSDRLKVRRKYTWLKEITSYLRGYVRFPYVELPQLDVPSEVAAIDANTITLAASQTRKFWGLKDGPISDVTLLLENNGVIVSKVALDTMRRDGFSSWDSLKALKSKWLVSIGAMLHRAAVLGMTTEKQAKGLWVNYTRRGWKTREPLDDRLVPECPRLLRRAFELVISKGVQEPEQIISDLCLSSSDINELSCLEEGLLVTPAHTRNLMIEQPHSRDLSSTQEYRTGSEIPHSLN